MTHPAFTLLERRFIREINGEAFRYRHDRTGADVVSVVCPDDNKAFGISFKTPPGDSTGVAHILEHCVLCGSRKYPLKEPFKELLKGSLQTFLNAMTYPDKTVYPVASRNLKDFHNLVDVYLDAVFFPRLGEAVFQQEGWHYEIKEPGAPLTFQGVVYNEMKGNYSSPDGVACELAQQSLFPDVTYGHDSGGNPRHIPDLTHAGFEAFHRRYYTPSNAKAFFWGDDDPARRLEILDAYFSSVPPSGESVEVPLQPRFTAPRRLTRSYMPNAEEGGAGEYVITGWMLDETTDLFRNLSMGTLCHLLVGTPASPLRKNLIESGLGDDLTGGGFENHTRQMAFSTGLKGVEPGDAEEVEALIFDTLRGLVERGFDPELIEAALNHMEFSLRENNTGTFPRGLACFLRMTVMWNHGGDPLEPLAYEKWLARLQERLRDEPRYFENLVRTELLDNPHRVTLVVKPDPGLGAEDARREQERLEAAAAAFGPDGLERVRRDTAALLAKQAEPDSAEALAAIPMLTPSDLETRAPVVPKETGRIGGTEVLFHPLPTNGIVYLDLAFDLRGVDEADLPLLPLFARALTEMGTRRRDYAGLSNLIARRTGGIDATLLTLHHLGTRDLVARLMLRAKATAARAGDMLDILREILLELRTDLPERFGQMLLEEISDAEEGVVPSGNSLVRSRLAAHFSLSEDCTERMDGVDYLHAMKALQRELDTQWPRIRSTLDRLAGRVLTRRNLLVNVTCEPGQVTALRAALEGFLANLPADAGATVPAWTHVRRVFPEGLTIPARVQFIGQSIPLYPSGYAYHASAQVATRWLRNGWLWDRVRVQGGAYGCSAGFDYKTGTLTFASYRDPQSVRTLDVYDGCPAFLREASAQADELQRAIIGAAGDLNPCLLPDARGYGSCVRHLSGVDDAFRQRIWDQVRSTEARHIREFADAIDAMRAQRVVCGLGPQDRLQELEARVGPLAYRSVF